MTDKEILLAMADLIEEDIKPETGRAALCTALAAASITDSRDSGSSFGEWANTRLPNLLGLEGDAEAVTKWNDALEKEHGYTSKIIVSQLREIAEAM